MEIDVLTEAPGWEALEAMAAKACPATLLACQMNPSEYAVAILGGDDARIAGLNEEFRGKAKPTNVLSWPAVAVKPPKRPPKGELGDIALALGVCTREAQVQNKDFDHHVTHLLVHATLHLLGYDHETLVDAAEMETIEVAVLASLGIPDPY